MKLVALTRMKHGNGATTMKKAHKKSKMAERATGRRSLHAVVRCVWLKQQMPKVEQPPCSIGFGTHDRNAYARGYADAVTKLHELLNTSNHLTELRAVSWAAYEQLFGIPHRLDVCRCKRCKLLKSHATHAWRQKLSSKSA